MEQLKSKLVESYDRLALGATEQNTFITNERQLHCLNLAQDCLLAYRSARNEGAFAEVLAFEVRSLVSALESMIGKVDVEDVLDRVFGEFCVGK
jgi:tRNA modification GTPase